MLMIYYIYSTKLQLNGTTCSNFTMHMVLATHL